METITVIIPTYNRPQWLEVAILSALNQKHEIPFELEIIVLDDGSSTDDAKKICNLYPVKYHYQKNRGLGAARNTALALSTGKLIQFLDDDDWLDPNCLSRKLQHFAQNPNLAAIYSDLYITDSNGSPLRRYYDGYARPLPTGNIYLHLLRKNFIPVHALLWRREILEQIGGFPERSGFEDWSCLLKAAEEGLFDYIDQPLGYYRYHSSNMSKQLSSSINWSRNIYTDIINSGKFTHLSLSQQSGYLALFSWKQWVIGDKEFSRQLINLAERKGKTLFVFLVKLAMLPGQPFAVFATRSIWKLRGLFDPTFSSTSAILRDKNIFPSQK